MSLEAAKRAAAVKAADMVEDGMHLGLGTGSTVAFFLERLIERCQKGLKVHALASSEKTAALAKKGKIPFLDEKVKSLDLTVDGADEVDEKKRMIKGGGGALLREKILAAMSREMVVIIDETKLVKQLGKARLPVEIVPFAFEATHHAIEKLGFHGAVRTVSGGIPFLTDNGNLIFDIHLKEPTDEPEKIHEALIHLPGVMETGFFFHLAGRLVIGFLDGQVVVKP